MKFPRAVSKLKMRSLSALPRFTHDNMTVGGILGVLLVFLGILAWDGYRFYTTRYRVAPRGISLTIKTPISAETIDAVIKILDERKEKFEKILSQ